MNEYKVTKRQLIARIMEREDNHYYRYEMVREIINMYTDEMRKAILNGESVNINGIGSIAVEVRYQKPNFSIPSNSDESVEILPFVDIHLNKKLELKYAADQKLRKNLIENGKLELSENKPTLTDAMKAWEDEYVKTHK